MDATAIASEPLPASAESRSELALARATLYRTLALAFRHPGESWQAEIRACLQGAQHAVAACAELRRSRAALGAAVEELASREIDLAVVLSEHAHALGHTPRAAATPYETEWSGAAGELLQFHQIADVSAFYGAFGLELGSRCDERADHVSVQLEFLQYLAVKEAWAEEQGCGELAALARETARKFLAEHLAQWGPGFARRLEAAGGEGFYGAAARVLREWIEDDSGWLGLASAAPLPEPGATTFREEDACFTCGMASTCGPKPGH